MFESQSTSETPIEGNIHINNTSTSSMESGGDVDHPHPLPSTALLTQIPCLLYEYKINHATGAACFPFCSHDFCEELLGVTGAAVMEDPNAMINLVHPEDTERFAISVGQSMQQLSIFDFRFRAWNVRRQEYIQILDRSLPYRSQEVNEEGLMEAVTIWKGFIIEDDVFEAVRTHSALDLSGSNRHISDTTEESKTNTTDEELAEDGWMWTDSPLIPCFSLDNAGTIRKWSDALQIATGYKAVDVQGRPFFSLIEETCPMSATMFFHNLQTQQMCEIVMHDTNGNDVHLILSAQRRQSVWCVACQNVTQLRDVEKQLNEATRLVESERSLTEWLSHEIRNPLSVVMEATQAMEQHSISNSPREERKESSGEDECMTLSYRTSPNSYLPMIRQSITYVVDILSSMLDLSKLADGKMSLHPEICNLYSDILLPTQQILHICGKVPVEIVGRDDDLHSALHVHVDRLRLRQVVTNLVSNAIKYTAQGHIRVSVEEEDNCFKIKVSDTGVGVKPSDYSSLFTRYEKLGSSINGSGIGLCLCKSLVKAMKGEVFLNKDYHSGIPERPGAQFVVRMPHKRRRRTPPSIVLKEALESVATKEMLQSAKKSLNISSKTQLRGKFNILVVDDDKIGQKMLARRFGRSFPEASVDCAISGELALDMVETKRYDLITMDHYMKLEEMNGSETIRALRHKGVDAAIVGISGNAKRTEHMASGADGFFQKPLPGNDIVFPILASILAPPAHWSVLLVQADPGTKPLADLQILAEQLHAVSVHHEVGGTSHPKDKLLSKRWDIQTCSDSALLLQLLNDRAFDLVVFDGSICRQPMLDETVMRDLRLGTQRNTVFVCLLDDSAATPTLSCFDLAWSPHPLPSVEEMRSDLFGQLLNM